MKKNYLILFLLGLLNFSLSAQNIKKGSKITVSLPSSKNIEKDEQWIPLFIQGQLLSDIQNYSDFVVIDRTAADSILAEQEKLEANAFINGDENTAIEYASALKADFLVSVNILKKSSDWSMECRLIDIATSKPVGKAYSNASISSQMLENGIAIHSAAYELLSGIGVDKKRLEPLLSQTENLLKQAAAQTYIAKGIVAEQNSMNIDALTYYLKATENSKNLKEAYKRLSFTSIKMSTGNIGIDAENKINFRNKWIELLRQTVSILEKEPPLIFLYNKDLKPLELTEDNYRKNTQSFSMLCGLFYTYEYDIIAELKKSLRTIPDVEKWGPEATMFPEYLTKKESWFNSETFYVKASLKDQNNKIISTVIHDMEYTDSAPHNQSRIRNIIGCGNTIQFPDIPVSSVKATDSLAISIDEVGFKYGNKRIPLDISIVTFQNHLGAYNFKAEPYPTPLGKIACVGPIKYYFASNSHELYRNVIGEDESGNAIFWEGKTIQGSENKIIPLKEDPTRLIIGGVPSFMGILTDRKDNCLIINKVIKDSPADKAGLKEGDIISGNGIIDYFGCFISNDDYMLFKPNDVITLTYTRDGKINTCKLKLCSPAEGMFLLHKEMGFSYDSVMGHSNEWLSSGELGAYTGIKWADKEKGMVASVDYFSPAWYAGIEKGDIIAPSKTKLDKYVKNFSPKLFENFDKQYVHSPEGLPDHDLLGTDKIGSKVAFTIKRNGKTTESEMFIWALNYPKKVYNILLKKLVNDAYFNHYDSVPFRGEIY